MTHLKSEYSLERTRAVGPQHPFVDRLMQSWPPQNWIDLPVVVAVSGGSDSVALLLGLKAMQDQLLGGQNVTGDAYPASSATTSHGKLIVGHFHHGFRGSDADDDASFVHSLCTARKIPCEIGYVDPEEIEKTPGEGWESTLRQRRYSFLLELAERHGARYVATGHTADDQVETILHRVVRGTGLRGLAGMPRSRPLSPAVSLIRPILTLPRSVACDYLQAVGIEWQTDASNADPEFTRNRIRHELLPLLENDFNPQVSNAILRLGQLAGEAQEMVDQVIAGELENCVLRTSATEIQLDVYKLVTHPDFLLREMLIEIWREAGWPLQAMGLNEWQSLAELLRQPDGAVTTLPGGVVAKKEGGKLSLHRPR